MLKLHVIQGVLGRGNSYKRYVNLTLHSADTFGFVDLVAFIILTVV